MKKVYLVLFSVLLLLLAGLAVFAFEGEIEDPEGNLEETVKPFVYISDNGNDLNDGQSSDSPVKTLERAYNILEDTGGIIVVCERLTLPQTASLPSSDKDIEFTSYHEGVDYKNEKQAEIYFDDTLNIKSEGKVTFYGLRFHSQRKANIYCNGTNVEFGARIENSSDDASYPSVFGGCKLDGSKKVDDGNFSDFTVSVSNGYWNLITLGNHRTTESAPMSTVKNATLIIDGGTFLASDSDALTTSAVLGAYISGKINLEINGGIFYGSVYAIGNEGDILPFMDLRYEADVSVKITNGTFSGKYIKALYSKDATLYGKYDFCAEGGSYSSLTYVGCEGVNANITLLSCESIQNKLYGFEKVVFVSKDGDDNNSGESPSSAKKTLSGAFAAMRSGGSIVICSEYNLSDGFVTRNTDQKIKITSKYYDVDYSQTNGAKLNIDGNLTLRSDIAFNNITLVSKNGVTLNSYAGLLEFGDGISVEGGINVILKQREGSHTFSMSSGSLSSFLFESSATSTYVSITGGTIEKFLGCSENHAGDIFVDFSGGTINGNVSIAPNGVGGNVQLIVGDAQIKEGISTQRPGSDKLCEALVVYNYDTAKLSGFDIIGDKYVFVRDGAKGNGSTPSLAAPTIDAALAYIGNSNACVVFCGKTTYKSDYTPKNVGIITYSSIYRNIDFASINGAKLVLENDYYFDNDATIQNLKIITNKKGISFHCNSNIVIFGYGLSCEIPFVNVDYYPSVIANDSTPQNPYNDKGESLSDKIIIQSGSWKNIYSSAATDLFGGVIYGSLYGTNDLSNNCSITVSGGTVYGGIYAAINARENASSHITITFNAGEIHGVIAPSYYRSSGYSGNFLINISGGDFTGLDRIENASFIGGSSSRVNIKEDIDMTAYTDSFITYKNPVSNSVSALAYENGMWYLAKADGNRIDLYSSNTISALEYTLPVYTNDTGAYISELSLSADGGMLYIFAKTYASHKQEMTVYVSKSLEKDAVSFIKLEGNDIKDYISPSVVTFNNEKYLYFTLEGENGADIYCVKVDSALNLLSDKVKVIESDRKWEDASLTSPRMIKSPDGKYYIAYTGGNINGASSMIGIAAITKSNLLSAASYKKNPDPVFYETETHKNLVLSSIVQIADAPEPYFVYTARVNGEHALIMQSFSFDSENVPYLSVPCDINTLYLAHYMPRTLTTLLSGFEVNRTNFVPDNSNIGKGFSLIKFLKENLFIVITCFSVIMAVVIIMVIKKLTQSSKSTPSKNRYERSSNNRRRASRLSVGREYAANLQKIEEAEMQEQAVKNSLDFEVVYENNSSIDASDLDETKSAENQTDDTPESTNELEAEDQKEALTESQKDNTFPDNVILQPEKQNDEPEISFLTLAEQSAADRILDELANSIFESTDEPAEQRNEISDESEESIHENQSRKRPRPKKKI